MKIETIFRKGIRLNSYDTPLVSILLLAMVAWCTKMTSSEMVPKKAVSWAEILCRFWICQTNSNYPMYTHLIHCVLLLLEFLVHCWTQQWVSSYTKDEVWSASPAGQQYVAAQRVLHGSLQVGPEAERKAWHSQSLSFPICKMG